MRSGTRILSSSEERLKVDQDIAATDQIDCGKKADPGQVLTREGAHIADGLSHWKCHWT